MRSVFFKKYHCRLIRSSYPNGRTALALKDARNGDFITKCTVNLPEEEIEDDEVFIKNYSENAGMVEALIDADVIETHPIRTVRSGFINIPLFKLK